VAYNKYGEIHSVFHKHEQSEIFESVREKGGGDHWVMLLVNWTGFPAEIDLGSALAMLSVYSSENLGNFEETTRPVLV